MHFTPHALYVMLVSHICIFVIDHAEQGREEPLEPVQVKDANIEQEQDKPWCI
jgi:hypothetical protein